MIGCSAEQGPAWPTVDGRDAESSMYPAESPSPAGAGDLFACCHGGKSNYAATDLAEVGFVDRRGQLLLGMRSGRGDLPGLVLQDLTSFVPTIPTCFGTHTPIGDSRRGEYPLEDNLSLVGILGTSAATACAVGYSQSPLRSPHPHQAVDQASSGSVIKSKALRAITTMRFFSPATVSFLSLRSRSLSTSIQPRSRQTRSTAPG